MKYPHGWKVACVLKFRKANGEVWNYKSNGKSVASVKRNLLKRYPGSKILSKEVYPLY